MRNDSLHMVHSLILQTIQSLRSQRDLPSKQLRIVSNRPEMELGLMEKHLIVAVSFGEFVSDEVGFETTKRESLLLLGEERG